MPDPGATSLSRSAWMRTETTLVRNLLQELAARIGAGGMPAAPTPALIADYRARSVTIGSRVRARLPR